MLGQRQETQRNRTPGLAVPQNISFATLGKIEIGQGETVQRRRHRRESFTGLGGLGQLGGEQAQTRMRSPADPAAQLVELTDTEPVGVHHHHHGRIGNVNPDLDNGGAHQDVDLPGPEVEAYFVYPEELRSSKRIAVFRDFLLRKVAEAKNGNG